jgi:hypothetical protein
MITEIVCPEFYVEQWRSEGGRLTEAPGTQFELSADDGVCRLLKTLRDEHGSTIFVCRCGMQFTAADGKHVEVK